MSLPVHVRCWLGQMLHLFDSDSLQHKIQYEQRIRISQHTAVT